MNASESGGGRLVPDTTSGPFSDPQRPHSPVRGAVPDAPRMVRCQYRRDPHPIDDECIDVADAYTDAELEAGLRRVAAALDPPPAVQVRPADRDDFDCSPYPEGDGRHDYRMTASSYYGVGRDHRDWRDGETCYRCRRCGDVFVALDSEIAAVDEERWHD